MSNEQFSQEDIDKAIYNYNKRLEYNKAWRERNPAKVKAIRQAYNKRKYAREQELLAIARERGQL